mmetsp:Transcript_70/g.196  ORF Transcript_70/g.196 Transcript_70/m.196 type:complete len:82 (-) Transcript_70:959-1204(-)
MWDLVQSTHQLLVQNGGAQKQSLFGLTLTRPEDAAASAQDAVKHADGAKDADMPDGFCACPQLYVQASSCECPYQYNHATY